MDFFLHNLEFPLDLIPSLAHDGGNSCKIGPKLADQHFQSLNFRMSPRSNDIFPDFLFVVSGGLNLLLELADQCFDGQWG